MCSLPDPPWLYLHLIMYIHDTTTPYSYDHENIIRQRNSYTAFYIIMNTHCWHNHTIEVQRSRRTMIIQAWLVSDDTPIHTMQWLIYPLLQTTLHPSPPSLSFSACPFITLSPLDLYLLNHGHKWYPLVEVCVRALLGAGASWSDEEATMDHATQNSIGPGEQKRWSRLGGF